MGTIYNIALVTHIVGIAMMAGTTFIDFTTFRQFWKTYQGDKSKGMVMADGFHRLQKPMEIGMLLILVSGITMMVYLHQVWGRQMWFQIKMGILVLIIINGFGVRRKLGSTLEKHLATNPSEDGFAAQLMKIRRHIRLAHVIQMAFFVTIFTLSIFKFN
ncbi:hypothetical protein [Negadavirga shengliensis]|uniref:DUF2214 family protein n=1 Tax=Negadavirga shengliensis TaxID=1389218 RepID=A0ABV9T7J9_9BACT